MRLRERWQLKKASRNQGGTLSACRVHVGPSPALHSVDLASGSLPAEPRPLQRPLAAGPNSPKFLRHTRHSQALPRHAHIASEARGRRCYRPKGAAVGADLPPPPPAATAAAAPHSPSPPQLCALQPWPCCGAPSSCSRAYGSSHGAGTSVLQAALTRQSCSGPWLGAALWLQVGASGWAAELAK